MKLDTDLTSEAIRNQLERILGSNGFKGSDKQKAFLSFVVDETLAERTSQLKGYTIGIAVYGRRDGFDPQVDPIVRVEAGRLRRALDLYYLTEGKNDPVRIDIPKGGYVPSFTTVEDDRHRSPAKHRRRPDGVLRGRPSIAVMPMLNLSGDEAEDYLAEGMTEELTVELSQFQEFRVIASQSTMRFKGQPYDPQEVGSKLGVRFLLTGSIRKDARSIKASVRLIDSPSNTQVWSESYKRNFKAMDVITLQEEIAQKAVGVIADQYGSITRRMAKDVRQKAPTDIKAYDAVLRFYHYETMLTPQAFEDARTALTHAIEIDPDYGLAWAMLGHLYADNYALGFADIEGSLSKALAYAQKGVTLEPENQFAHDAITLVHFHRGDKKAFLKHVEETLSLNPNAPYIVGVAGWHMALYGEWERGLELLEKGMQLNPFHPSWFHLVTFLDCYRRDDFDNALTEALKFNYPELYLDPMMRAAALGPLKRNTEARAALNELLALEPDFAETGREMIGKYVKVESLIDKIMIGLQAAGLSGPGPSKI